MLHIPPVNKRSETKRVLIQLAAEGWGGCRVAESSSPSSLQPRPATGHACRHILGTFLGPWCAPQKVASRSASVSMAPKMLFPFWKISCTVFSIPRPTMMFPALPWNIMASRMSVSASFDETSQLMSPQVISLFTMVTANLGSHGFLLAVTLNTC